ncbi:MAG: hypothetical protein KGD66_05880 [Candidatus Lokiarchaeota archaeon]|nr:hypothetical protein [Candidatus Lokiarchaeota archaeon]
MAEVDLNKLFLEWHELNKKTEKYFGEFNFSKIKELRKGQNKLEDKIYSEVKKSASEPIKKILPDEVGELEVGYEVNGSIFYFVMIDPSIDLDDDDEEIRLIAIAFDENRKIEIINDFKIED